MCLADIFCRTILAPPAVCMSAAEARRARWHLQRQGLRFLQGPHPCWTWGAGYLCQAWGPFRPVHLFGWQVVFLFFWRRGGQFGWTLTEFGGQMHKGRKNVIVVNWLMSQIQESFDCLVKDSMKDSAASSGEKTNYQITKQHFLSCTHKYFQFWDPLIYMDWEISTGMWN